MWTSDLKLTSIPEGSFHSPSVTFYIFLFLWTPLSCAVISALRPFVQSAESVPNHFNSLKIFLSLPLHYKLGSKRMSLPIWSESTVTLLIESCRIHDVARNVDHAFRKCCSDIQDERNFAKLLRCRYCWWKHWSIILNPTIEEHRS